MKRGLFIIIVFCLSFSFINEVKAEVISKSGFINCIEDNSSLPVRDLPAIAGTLQTNLTCNSSVNVTDDNAGTSDEIIWYKIKYNNNVEGYVNSKYIAFDYLEAEENLSIIDNKGYVSCVENNEPLSVRPNIDSYDTVTSLTCDTEMTIINNNAGSNARCTKWYEITSGSYTGYVCGDYVYQKATVSMTEEHILEYKDYLRSVGFHEESYLNYLVELHSLHPNWQFRAVQTRTNWSTVIANEYIQGRNLIYKSFDDGYRSDDSYSYDYATDTYYRHPTEINWWYASEEAIEYYMDPRNFLNTNNIFMFESLYYQPLYQTTSLVRSLLDSSFMPNIYANTYGEANRYTYANDFIEAAGTYNISPIHLASRILQEGNSTTSITYNGTIYNVFNFFNIRATGTNPAYQGLVWAANITDPTGSYGRAWDTPKKSILGGSQFLVNDYIGVGQNNLYLQKFAVYTTNPSVSLYSHQYMQNLTAPVTEGIKIYSSYNNLGKLEESFVFIIPVYNIMPSTAVAKPNPGNPNSYLNSIKINGTTIQGFTYNNTDYMVNVPYNTTSINLSATTINANATLSGTGTITLVDKNTIKLLEVTAGNGTKTTYNITINKESSPINTLNNITIDKIPFTFDKDTLNYNLNVAYNITNINISYEKTDTNSTVTGLTSKDLVIGANILQYVVTAENGTTKTYIINVIRADANGTTLSSINTLNSLTIDKIPFTFDKETITYDLTVPYETSNINITYEKDDEESSVFGDTNVSLNLGTNNTTLLVIAENGEMKTYTLNIIREDMSVETVLNSSGVKYNTSYISGINIGTNVNTLISKVASVNSNVSIIIKDKDDNVITDTAFKTGYKVIMTALGETKTHEIVLLGDMNGDGEITKSDMLAMQKQIFGYSNLEGAYKFASDINKDDSTNKSDLLAMQRHIFGYSSIKQ